MELFNLSKEELIEKDKTASRLYKEKVLFILDNDLKIARLDFSKKYNIERWKFNHYIRIDGRSRPAREVVKETINDNIEKELLIFYNPAKVKTIMDELNSLLSNAYNIYKALRACIAVKKNTRQGSLFHSEIRLLKTVSLYLSEGKITEDDILNLLKSKNLSPIVSNEHADAFKALKTKEERTAFCLKLRNAGHKDPQIASMIGRTPPIVCKLLKDT